MASTPAEARAVAGAPGAAAAPAIDPLELAALPPVAAALAELAPRRRVALGGLWGSSQALALAAAARRTADGPRRAPPWCAVAATDMDAYLLADDLAEFGFEAAVLPARGAPREGHAARRAAEDLEALRERLQVAALLGVGVERQPRILVASLAAMLEPLPSPDQLAAQFLTLERGARLDAERVLAQLGEAGYRRVPLVERPGELSRRGDVLDVYPFAAELPLRIELFGDEIESLRSFDPLDQRSIESFERAAICAAGESDAGAAGQGASVMALLDARTLLAVVEPLRVQDQAEGLRMRSAEMSQALLALAGAMERHAVLELASLPGRQHSLEVSSVQGLQSGLRGAREVLAEAVADGSRAVLLARSEGEERRFGELLAGLERVSVRRGSVARGFRVPALRAILLNARELAGIEGVRRREVHKPQHRVRALRSFFELAPGDLVVHAVHGLARFLGLERIERNGGEEDHLALQFSGDVTLYVPAGRIDLVQRYVGGGGGRGGGRGGRARHGAPRADPELDRIGGTSFRRRKERVARALRDLAAELLEVQAAREASRREPWPADSDLVREALAAFPHVDTPDQTQADREISADLFGPRPMDRLLCGDVGFGKTEVALRAAFRVAAGGAQVAFLVPTTVLARQHHETARERFAGFPLEVAVLSRLTPGAEARQILERLASGRLDLVVGTHRLLGADVRFRRLGLAIVDEEQRFGVQHKEHFKRLRASVDVLTLTATPIPRTLHMSLAGVRDISALSTPPEGRQGIETRLAWRDERELLREALLSEKRRGGQIFFLHNKVYDIERVAGELRALAPECSFAVAHGQMGARALERVMSRFTHGQIDVLVSTTIVENGIDIPAAGTIVIDEAELYGLAELHQLRGRVGRGRQKATCWLLVERGKALSEQARARLKSLEELSGLGAGFGISMRDLELRGAGNLLGPEQSGHIDAVGYDMYCRLLRQTVEAHKTGQALDEVVAGAERPGGHGAEVDPGEVDLELGLRAFLAPEWISGADQRLEALRQLDAIRSAADADAARAALRDRFGRVPAEADELVRQFALRVVLAGAGITRLAWRRGFYLVEFRDRVALERALAPLAGARAKAPELRTLRTGVAHLVIPEDDREPRAALAWLEAHLKHAGAASKMPAASGVAPALEAR